MITFKPSPHINVYAEGGILIGIIDKDGKVKKKFSKNKKDAVKKSPKKVKKK